MIRRAVNSRSFPYIWLWIFTLISIRTAVCETPSNHQVKIQTINYNWVDEEKVEVTVCLESEADGTPFGQLDLLVTNDLGRAWRARGGGAGGGGGGGGASRKTEEAFCFAGLSLEKKDLAKTLRFRVLETGRDEPVQELETFVVVPEVTPASEGAYEICWEDPEGLAFALAEGGVARPLVAPSAGCHECCLAVAPKNPGDLVTLETAGTKDLRQLVQIRLPVDLAGGQMKPHAARVPLAIKELHKVPREDDPSGKSQNMRVFLDPHEAKDADDFQLSLTLASGAGQETYFLYKIIDEDATEIEFEGNFQDSIAVIIKAMKGDDVVGLGSVVQNLTDPGSRVAKVGDASAPSLRVDPGARDQVEVPGKPPCVRGSGPCYYVGQSDPPPPLCEDFPKIRFCDAVVSELQNPAEVPALELRNRQELRVQQPRPDGARTEVVVSSDDSILPPDGFGCNDLGDGTCAHPVVVADDLDGFDVTLVVLDDEGYVTASLAVPFEVHGVAALSLSQDVLQVAVDPRSGGAYEVTLAGPSPPPAAPLECQAGSPCRVWFAGMDAPPAVTVRKGSNAIYEATSGPPPPASRVERLTSHDADARMDVEVASDKHVTRADLVTFSSDVATDADCESLAATPSKSGYSVAASSRGAGDWNFLVVGYDDDGALLEAGRAHVTLSDILLPRMTKVGTEALQSLKVETGEMDVKVNGFLCSASTVCYYLEPENILEPPEVCRMAAPNIEQCDMTAAYIQPESLIERSVQLSFTGVPEEDLMITADFSETSLTMEAKLYTNSEDLTPNPLTCEITGRSPKTCTFKVEPKDTEFKILLMALDSESTVKDSTVVEFEDFQTRIQQLTSDAIEVRWRASQNQEYDVEIGPEIEVKFNKTSVICGGEEPEDSKMCLAYFFTLNLNEDYTASVRAQGDNKYVSASVRMQTVLETINITELTLTTTEETRGLNVCFTENHAKKKQNEGGKMVNKLVAVDANGRQMALKSSHTSVSDVEEKLCLGPLPLNLDFNLSDKVRVLVSRENLDTQEILLSGDAELFVSEMKPHAALVHLTIKELQKVSREDDPSGRRQNMRVFLDPHEAIEADDFQLELIVGSNGFQEIHHLFKIIDEDATELEFEGNFKDSIQVFIKAMKGGVTVGFGSVTQEMTDPGSRVAKVGDASAPSLRVDPGARGQVEVPGKPPCVRGSGPCYYVGQSDPPPPLCEDLSEIRFCDAVVSEVQNPAEVPALELRNRQELRVQQPRPDGAWTEVVVSSARDDSILPPDGFGCDDLGDGTCAHPVAVADDLDGFDVTLVVLDDEGYVTASLAVPFEVHGVAALSLFQDVLQVAVDPRSGGAYEVTLAGPSPPPAATLECQAGSPCRVWFAGVDAPPAVTVRKGSNAIYEATSGPPPPASRVERLTSRDADARMDVEVASDQPVTRADLLTFKNDVATDADCENLAATPSKSGYSVAASSRGAGDWNFLVVGYDDDGALLEAGRAHVTLSDILLPRMTKVGTEALQSLKVETGEMDVKVNGFLCPASKVCYDLEPENILEPPEVCRIAAPNIEQCDMTAVYIQPESLINPLVQLSFTGAPEEDLMITADFSETSLTMEAKLYTNSEVLTPNPLTCEITGRSPKTCIFKAEPKVTEFKILLMALDSESTVKDSTVVEFEDFQTRIQQLTSDAIEVRWRASHNQKYDVEIAPEIEGKFSNTSVICGGEKPEDSKMCLAYFIGLNLNEDYTAGVRAQGDRESVSASVKVETVLETINITELTLTTTGETRGLTVCFMESREERKQNEEGNIVNKLVAVDANGRQVQMVSKSSQSSVSDVEEKLCLGPLHLDLDYDLSNKVWILVSRENLDTQETLSGGAELFLLDLNDVSQVGAKTLRATWTNRNGAPSFEVGMGVGDFMSVECGVGEDAKEECLRYLHAEGTSKQVTVTLREIGLSVQQEVQVTFTLKELTDIRITKTELNRDSRLRVCFESDLKDSLYLLALENEEGDVQEFPQLHPYLEDGLTCVLSNDAIQEEGYVALRTLLTAYDVSGTEVQASGSTNVTGIFLNPRSKVSAALNSDTHGLLVSWFLLGDPSSISSYDVALEETAAGGSNKPVTVGNTESSLVFSDTTPGRYSVCVAASVEEHHMTSGRVCSAILSIPQEDVVVPNIAETSLKSSGPKKVLVTWQKPQEDADVSSYVITWSSSSSVSSSPSSPSSSTTPGLANLPVLHPLGLIQRARPLGDDVQDLSFVVLPAATTSVEVEDLEASQNYEMCVSSVKSDVMGTPTCSEVNQGDYQPLDSPKNLTHEDEVLRWADVPGAASYLVEWQADYEGELSEGGLEEVNGTSWPTQDLPPGAWVVEVRAVSDTSASEAASITIRKAGIVVGQPTQTSNSHLEISWWEEPVPSCNQPPYEYSITLLIDGKEKNYDHSCSGCRGDCTKLLDVEGAKEIVVVKVERDTKSSQVELRVYAFKAVSKLRQRFSSGGEEVALSWAPTEDARLYNVTLFADADLVSVRKAETISREAYTLKGSDLVGNVFQVQPCADVHTCGDSQRIRLQESSDPAPEYDLIIIIVSVVGGVVVVSIIGSLVAVFMKKKKTKKEMENLRRQKEPPVPLSDYDGWGEARLDVRAQLRPQVPVYDEWGSRRLGQGPQPPRQ